MVYIIRCNDIVSDPRAMKYVHYLRKTGHDFKLIGWDRDNKIQGALDSIYYKKRAGHNVGGMKAAFNRIGWMWFVLCQLRKLPKEKVFLHCCDLDAAFPAAIYKKFFNREAFLLFDVFDWFSASISTDNWFISHGFSWMEKISMKWTDHYIICEKEREEQFPCKVDENKLSILPNIPYFENNEFLSKDISMSFDNELITFSYVGGFADTRCIDEIISIAEKGKINLLIAGFGVTRIEDRLNSLKDSNHIKYFGKVKYKDGLNIMYNSDVIYAMYSKVLPNHIYAAPNKYYEAMFLEKPIFTTAGTKVGEKVKKHGIGYISEESEREISDTIDNIKKDDLKNKGEVAHKMWTDEFSVYTESFLSNKYEDLLNE